MNCRFAERLLDSNFPLAPVDQQNSASPVTTVTGKKWSADSGNRRGIGFLSLIRENLRKSVSKKDSSVNKPHLPENAG
jgi:hypothetical protein